MERKIVYYLIDSERDYQEKLHPDGRILPIEGELVLIRNYLRKAEAAYSDTFGDLEEIPTTEVIRKIAAICVRCMEHHRAVGRVEEVEE